MSPKQPLSTPKQRRHASRNTVFFEYYAGFASSFVNDLLESLAPQPGALILDPWNGAGTTTEVASRRGLSSVGIDLNPAMVVVAKARTLDPADRRNITSALDSILVDPKTSANFAASPHDPLGRWFSRIAVQILRQLDHSIRRTFQLPSPGLLAPTKFVERLSPLSSYLYVAFFRTVRHFLTPFTSSNPTWIKTANHSEDRLTPPRRLLYDVLEHYALSLADALSPIPSSTVPRPPQLTAIDSRNLPLEPRSVDLIISSPPYCTRIDYAVATLPELASLGTTDRALLSLRRALLGGPLVTPSSSSNGFQLRTSSTLLKSLLTSIRTHPSKASSTYYLHYFRRYFYGAQASLRELDRVLKPGALCNLVLQGSFYKDLTIDLPAIYAQLAAELGWVVEREVPFQPLNSILAINSRSRRYRKLTPPRESLLSFRKPSTNK